MKKIKVAIVDDHNLFREGLGFLLAQSEEIDVIGEASNGYEFLKLLDTQLPDLVLMDIAMPKMDGVEATRIAIDKYHELKIIALSMFEDQEYYYKMIHAGAHGFILTKSTGDELFKAIKDVMSGENYFSKELLKSIIINMPDKRKFKFEGDENLSDFTKREYEIISLLCTGLSSTEIADKLFISKKTVEGHKSNLFSKTGSKNTVSLVMYAIKNKLIEV